MTGHSNSILVVENIEKRYGNNWALDGVSFSVNAGEVVGLLGPNGAGKTSIIRMLLDITRPDSGLMTVFGEKPSGRTREKIGYLPEERGLYPKQRIQDVLNYLASLSGIPKNIAPNLTEKWLERVGLEDWKLRRVRELSKGMQQKVQLGAAVLHKPELLILDEPFSGLDPLNRRLVNEIVCELRDKGAGIIISTHMMDEVEQLCDKVVLLRNGKLLLSGSVEEVRSRFSPSTITVGAEPGWTEKPKIAELIADSKPAGALLQEITLRDDAEPMEMHIALASERIRVNHFSRSIPSLNEVFVKVVQSDAVAPEIKSLESDPLKSDLSPPDKPNLSQKIDPPVSTGRNIRRDKFNLIFRRELWTTITRPGFIISTLALPVLPFLMILLNAIMEPERILAGDRPATVAVVDESGLLDLDVLEKKDPEWLPGNDVYIAYPDRETAKLALTEGLVTGAAIIPEDFLERREIDTFRLREGLSGGFVRPYGGQLGTVVHAALLEGRIPEEMLNLIISGIKRKETVLDEKAAEIPEEVIADDVRRFLVPVVAAVFLAVAIFAGAGYLLLGLSEEKENRVMELLLANLSPEELLAGKLWGIGTAGLLQFSVWVTVVAVPAVILLPGLGIKAGQVLWATGFFLAGYLFFGAVMLGIGAITDTARHAQQISGVFSMFAMAPFLFNFLILQDPASLLSRILTFIPVTAPLTVMLRMSIEPPHFAEMAAALAFLSFSGFMAMKGAARLFRATSLLYGKTPTPKEIWRWLVYEE